MQDAKKIKISEPTIVGLTNLGNTCFLNSCSCLQVLNHKYELNTFLHCYTLDTR